jgi:uncharacterized protein YggL (DUF469 family)
MKKRLRKKKHRGEFSEWGRQLVITRNRKDQFDEFIDAFIDIIEANDCYCGGGGKEDSLDVIVELGVPADDRDARMKSIESWLKSRPDVQSWRVGEEFDLWYGNYEEIEDKIEQQASYIRCAQ